MSHPPAMAFLQSLASRSVLLLAAACSSSAGSNSNDGGADASGSDATQDSTQSADSGADATSDSTGGGDVTSDDGPAGDATSCGGGFLLCNGYCVNANNDIHNCGKCGTVCNDTNPYCDNGTCTTAPCDGGQCGSGMFCCGTDCCAAGQLCCDVPSNIPTTPKCTTPVNGTCPVGCPVCP
jgi:hypothetical protein